MKKPIGAQSFRRFSFPKDWVLFWGTVGNFRMVSESSSVFSF